MMKPHDGAGSCMISQMPGSTNCLGKHVGSNAAAVATARARAGVGLGL